MSKFFTKHPNRHAIVLSNFHSNFEDGIAGLRFLDFKNRLVLKSDPQSQHHVLVQDEQNPNLKFRVEKADIELANHDRHALYHLLAIVLNHFHTPTA